MRPARPRLQLAAKKRRFGARQCKFLPKKGGIGQIFESNAYLRAAGFAVKSPSQNRLKQREI